ncbi:hypothetical protein GQ43DRAFT_420931 [Delitschia confertaspora ATCC 74209]|uniref:Reverse transcriptase Ty1/copia-type domain-containing protein n=1 Tax=Delitschia confertaspora ATCC 74209 TaxID=1513339 RepID=A0A9P4JGT8_9PLEO|nr:hypothetical protein GQ43DRAFT_420931 [Delitschia confertaspora ATCC 74209]
MYSLQRSARLWYEDLCRTLKDFKFLSLDADPCVYFKETTKETIVAYFNDLLLLTKTEESMANLKSSVLKTYEVVI